MLVGGASTWPICTDHILSEDGNFYEEVGGRGEITPI